MEADANRDPRTNNFAQPHIAPSNMRNVYNSIPLIGLNKVDAS